MRDNFVAIYVWFVATQKSSALFHWDTRCFSFQKNGSLMKYKHCGILPFIYNQILKGGKVEMVNPVIFTSKKWNLFLFFFRHIAFEPSLMLGETAPTLTVCFASYFCTFENQIKNNKHTAFTTRNLLGTSSLLQLQMCQ